MFNTLLLLQAPGEVVYFGPTKELPDHLESVGLGRCPENFNIADYIYQVLEPKSVGGKRS